MTFSSIQPPCWMDIGREWDEEKRKEACPKRLLKRETLLIILQCITARNSRDIPNSDTHGRAFSKAESKCFSVAHAIRLLSFAIDRQWPHRTNFELRLLANGVCKKSSGFEQAYFSCLDPFRSSALPFQAHPLSGNLFLSPIFLCLKNTRWRLDIQRKTYWACDH